MAVKLPENATESNAAVVDALKEFVIVLEEDVQQGKFGDRLLGSDLGLDSLDLNGLLMKIEERVGIQSEDLEAELEAKKGKVSVHDLQAAVWNAVQKKIVERPAA